MTPQRIGGLLALIPLLVIAGAWSCLGAEPASMRKPNIVFVLADDLGEKVNLAAERADKAKGLRDRLHAWLSEVGAQLPSKNETVKR